MDTITHLVMGHAMGAFAIGATPAVQAGAYWGAFVGNSLPDIDVPVGYLLGRGWSFHRKFTHTVPGILGLSLVAASVITLSIPGSVFGVTWAWTLAGCVIHVFMDCLNLFGVRPLWPFSNRGIGWGILFIMDPIILGALGLGGLAHLLGLLEASVLRVVYALVWVYIAGRWLVHGRLGRLVTGPDVIRAHVVPYLAFWRYFRETPQQLEYGRVHALTGRLRPIEAVAAASGPEVDASRTHPRVKAFLRAARYPFAQVQRMEAGYKVIWEDLFMRLRGWRQGVEVQLDENLQPQE